jgi:predicted chitinase
MSVGPSAGTLIAISATNPGAYTAAGYNAIASTFVNIGEIVNGGEFGREDSLVTHNPLATRGTQKFKGSFNEGAQQLQLALDTDDAGQILAKTASLATTDYSFRVTMPNGDKYFYRGKVMSWKVGVNGVDDMTSATMNVEITTSSAGVGIVESLAA